MKSTKIPSLLSIVLAFTILVAVLPPAKVARGQQDFTVIFQEDFEGADPGWDGIFTQGTGASVDMNATHMPYAGSEHGEYNFSAGLNVAASGYKSFGDYYPNLTFSAWYSMNDTASWRNMVQLRGDGGELFVLLYSYGDWRAWFMDGLAGSEAYAFYEMDVDRYHNITIESFINTTNGYHRVCINGTQIFNIVDLNNTRRGDISGMSVGGTFMEDAYASISIRVDDVIVRAGPPNHEVRLDAGWNLVSFPMIPTDPSFSSIFSTVSYYVAYTWDGNSYVTATTAEAGMSYWIFMLSAATINITGTPVNSYERNLPTGWSLIGNIANSTVPASTVFPDYYELVWWSGASYVPSTQIDQRAYERLGKGYWALVLEPTQIIVDPP